MSSMWSKLFGGKKPNPVEGAIRQVEKLLVDESFQLSLVNPQLRSLMENAAGVDRLSGGYGKFGEATNPIPVNGPLGEIAYLSRLVDPDGQRLLFHRTGSDRSPVCPNPLDVYECVSFNGEHWYVLYLDMYHPRQSRATPDGFTLSQEPRQFSGFNNACSDFPYDFSEEKRRIEPPELALAYIPSSAIEQQLMRRAFLRPTEA
jgi:hypothetical protein